MRGLKIESIKAWTTLFFSTATFSNLNNFVLETFPKCLEKIRSEERRVGKEC